MQTRLRQGREEQIGTCQAPDDLAFRPRGNAGREQGGRRAIDGTGPAAGAFMQRPMGQSAARKPLVDLGHAERQNASLELACAFQVSDLPAQTVEDSVWDDSGVHDLL